MEGLRFSGLSSILVDNELDKNINYKGLRQSGWISLGETNAALEEPFSKTILSFSILVEFRYCCFSRNTVVFLLFFTFFRILT